MELGFSIYEQILERNLKEQPLMAQKIVFEEVSKDSGILKVDIRKKIISEVY